MFQFINFIVVIIISSEVRIGLVDLKKITEQYEGIKEAKAEIDKALKEWEEELSKKKNRLDSLKSVFEAEKPGLSEEARLKRELEIKKLEREYKSFIKEIWGKGGRLERLTQEKLAPFSQKIKDMIKKIAEEEQVEIVLDISKDAVLYAKSGVDLTDRVIEALNREYLGVEIEAGVIEKFRIALLPFKTDVALRTSPYLSVFLKSIEEGMQKYPKFELKGFEISRNIITSRGYDENTLPEGEISFVIQALGVDYAVWGELKRRAEGVWEIKYYIYNLQGKKIEEFSFESPEKEVDLKDAGFAIAQRIIEYFKKE